MLSHYYLFPFWLPLEHGTSMKLFLSLQLLRLMTHGTVFADSAADSAAESSRSSIASDGIRHTQQGSPTGGRFAGSASHLLAVQRAV
jgi:hypothetical protein